MAIQAQSVVAATGMQVRAIEPGREHPDEVMLGAFGSIFE